MGQAPFPIGWYQTHWPNHHHELNFSLTAPKGHLPFLPVWQGAWWGGFLAEQGQRFYTLIQRAQSCRLVTHLNPQPINDQPPSATDPQDPLTALGEQIESTFKDATNTIAKGTGLSQD